MEGGERAFTVVNLRHLTIYKSFIYRYNMLDIWEFGLTKSYFRNFIYIFIYPFTRLFIMISVNDLILLLY